MGKVDRGYDFDRLEEAELLSVNALYVANNQPFGKNPAHAAGDNPIADPDLFLAQDKVEDQALSFAAADTASPVVLQETGHSRRCVGNQKDPGKARAAADNTTDHTFGDNHRHPLDHAPFGPFVDGDGTEPAGRILGDHPGRQSRKFLGFLEVQQSPQRLFLER